jgi:hypothetical protein
MTDASTKEYLPSLRTPPSTYSSHIRYTLYEFPELFDSTSISSAGWTQIATTIQNNYLLFDGFVILHGTDSLAYTSSALSFMCAHLGKPIILTGSQASIFALQSDAVDNLLGSLIIAGTFMIPEVCLFFHHHLYRGNRTTVRTSFCSLVFFVPSGRRGSFLQIPNRANVNPSAGYMLTSSRKSPPLLSMHLPAPTASRWQKYQLWVLR